MEIEIINKGINETPAYAKVGDSGMDVRADFSNGLKEEFFSFADWDSERKVLMIFPGGRALIPTGLYSAIPEGYEIQVRPRSGLALKQGITVLNTPGTIDAGYRNEWGIILINLGNDVFEISQGDRIAQIVLAKVEQITWKYVSELGLSDRGLTGFGDSGIK